MRSLRNMAAMIAVIIILAMSITLLAGCGRNTAQTPATQTSAAQNTAQASGTQTDATQNTNQTPGAQTDTAQNTGSKSGDVQGTDTDGDGIPDAIEKTYGTNPYAADTDGDGVNDKQDNQPTFAENPIKETGTADLPIAIKDAKVEDNATADHLEISITNTGKDDLTNLDIYYTITDKVANKSEAYYEKLDGLSIKAGETQTIHFDNDVSKPGHYYGNMNGLYGTSANGLTFDVTLHGAGCKPYVFTVEKAKGTAEVAD